MQKRKLMSLLAVTAVLVACLCGCGKEKNSMDYKTLKELLDNGQYDSAISMIKEYRDAEYLAENQDKISDEEEELLEKIAGTYTPNVLSTEVDGYGYYKEIVVDDDLTLTIDDNTYPYRLRSNRDSVTGETYYYLEYKKDAADGGSFTTTLGLYMDENDYVWIDNSYIRRTDLEENARKNIKELVGEYVSYYPDKNPDLRINDDMTMTVAGTNYPIEYVYSNSTYYYSVVGYERYPGINSSSLYYNKNDLNFITLWDSYYRPEQLYYVTITPDNLYDYFEWSDWIPQLDTNAFNELSSIGICRYLKLKDEYTQYYYKEASTHAMEFTYTLQNFYDFSFTYDANTNSVTTQCSDVPDYISDPATKLSSYMDSKSHWEGDNNVLDFYYVLSESNYESVDSQKATIEGNKYTFNTSYYNYYNNDGFALTRSNTTLAFIKDDLK